MQRFPHPKYVTDKIWLKSANWSWRYICSKLCTTDDGALLYYKLTLWALGSSELKCIFASTPTLSTTSVIWYFGYWRRKFIPVINNLKKRSFGKTASRVWKQQTRFYWVCSWGIMADATSLMPPSPRLSATVLSNKSVILIASLGLLRQ